MESLKRILETLNLKSARDEEVIASEEIEPISDVGSFAEYRRTLSRILAERALKEVVASSSA